LSDTDLKPKPHPGWSLAIDYGPLLVFFLSFRIGGIFAATGSFMVAILIAIIVSRWRLNRVSPMLWLSAVLVLGFGGLTLWLHDPVMIRYKATAVYVLLSSLLFIGLARGKPLLKYVLEAGYDGLTDRGWMMLSRNWAWFFAALAAANQLLIYLNVSDSTYVNVKVGGFIAVTFLFALANIPMMMKHGFGEDAPPPA
jgi:intracellular septation protein